MIVINKSMQVESVLGREVLGGSILPSTDVIRFFEKVRIVDGECWPWTGCTRGLGGRLYGSFYSKNKIQVASRFSCTLFWGEIPKGYHVHHKCNNPICVNPDHLEAVHPTVHMKELTFNSITYKAARKTHCDNGHPLSGENLFVDKRGHRQCLTCMKANCKAARRRWREKNPLPPKTHCSNGHPWTEENLGEYNGKRFCKLCRADTMKAWRENAKATGWVSTPRSEGPRTVCCRNHEMTPENTYTDKDGYTSCRACRQLLFQEWKKRKNAAEQSVA